jgi:hypothetical protein
LHATEDLAAHAAPHDGARGIDLGLLLRTNPYPYIGNLLSKPGSTGEERKLANGWKRRGELASASPLLV